MYSPVETVAGRTMGKEVGVSGCRDGNGADVELGLERARVNSVGTLEPGAGGAALALGCACRLRSHGGQMGTGQWDPKVTLVSTFADVGLFLGTQGLLASMNPP